MQSAGRADACTASLAQKGKGPDGGESNTLSFKYSTLSGSNICASCSLHNALTQSMQRGTHAEVGTVQIAREARSLCNRFSPPRRFYLQRRTRDTSGRMCSRPLQSRRSRPRPDNWSRDAIRDATHLSAFARKSIASSTRTQLWRGMAQHPQSRAHGTSQIAPAISSQFAHTNHSNQP